jgi:hypothetical protein
MKRLASVNLSNEQPTKRQKTHGHSTTTNGTIICYLDWLPPELIEEIINFTHQLPILSTKYFYTNRTERMNLLKRRVWKAGIGLTVRFLNSVVFPMVGQTHKMGDFDYSLAHDFTFGRYANHEENCNVIIRGKRHDLISYLAEMRVGSWLLYFSDQQYTRILDISNSPFDYYTGDEGHYSFRACLRKHTPVLMSVPKLLIKVATHVYFELVVVLSYDTLDGIQSVYAEEMNIFFAKPTLNDPTRLIWNQMKEIQYPFIDCITHRMEFNVIQLFGLDQFLLINNEDSVHWELFRKVQANLLNRTTGVFQFLQVGLLPTLIHAITTKKQKLIDEANRLATDNNLISLLLLNCVSSDLDQTTFCNLNWSYISEHTLSKDVVTNCVHEFYEAK